MAPSWQLPPEIVQLILAMLEDHDVHNMCAASQWWMANSTRLVYNTDIPTILGKRGRNGIRIWGNEERYRVRVLNRLISDSTGGAQSPNLPVKSLTLLGRLRGRRANMDPISSRLGIELAGYRLRVAVSLAQKCSETLSEVSTHIEIPGLQETLVRLPLLQSLSVVGSQDACLTVLTSLRHLRVFYNRTPSLVNPSRLPRLESLGMYFKHDPFFTLPASLIRQNLLRLDTLPSLSRLELCVSGHYLRSAALSWCSGRSSSIENALVTGPFKFNDASDLSEFLDRLGGSLRTLSIAGLRYSAQQPRPGLPETTVLPSLQHFEWHDTDPALLLDLSLPQLRSLSLEHRDVLSSRQITNILRITGVELRALSIVAKEVKPFKKQIYSSQVIYHLMRFTKLSRFQSWGPYYFSQGDWELLKRRLLPSLQFLGMQQPHTDHDSDDLCYAADAEDWPPLSKLPGRGVFIHPSDNDRWDHEDRDSFRSQHFFDQSGLSQSSSYSMWRLTERENEIRTDREVMLSQGFSAEAEAVTEYQDGLEFV